VLSSVHFTLRDLKKKIRELKQDSVPGLDRVMPHLLKEMIDEVVPVLVLIFTKSLEEGLVQVDCKEVNINPIFKKGAKSAPCIYRPVSLTSVACKLMESLIRDEVTNTWRRTT